MQNGSCFALSVEFTLEHFSCDNYKSEVTLEKLLKVKLLKHKILLTNAFNIFQKTIWNL